MLNTLYVRKGSMHIANCMPADEILFVSCWIVMDHHPIQAKPHFYQCLLLSEGLASMMVLHKHHAHPFSLISPQYGCQGRVSDKGTSMFLPVHVQLPNLLPPTLYPTRRPGMRPNRV